MLAIFVDEDGKILFTYPGEAVSLGRGDEVLLGQQEHVILRKRFNVDAGTVELFLGKKPVDESGE